MARKPKPAETASDFPHPRLQAELFGHEAAEDMLLHACQSQRLHHAWMICGPRGIGKATLAYRAARFILAKPDGGQGAETLYVPEHDNVFHLVAQGVHPDCNALELEASKKSISIDAVRDLSERMYSTSSGGGWRVAVIDAIEELNTNAANALLKLLEEPPPRCLFLLVSHQPGLMKMTLRSRCQKLHLKPLDDKLIMKVAQSVAPEITDKIEAVLPYACGSAGRALNLANGGGLAERDMLRVTLENLPRMDAKQLQQLCDSIARKGEEAFSEAVELVASWCHDLVTGQPDDAYAKALADFSTSFNEGAKLVSIFNLDRKAFLITRITALGRLVHMQAAT